MQKVISEPSTAPRPLHLLGTRNCSVALQSKNSALSDANTSLLQHHYCSYVSQMNDVGLISFLNQTQQAMRRTIANTYKLMEPTFCSKQIFKATIFLTLGHISTLRSGFVKLWFTMNTFFHLWVSMKAAEYWRVKEQLFTKARYGAEN